MYYKTTEDGFIVGVGVGVGASGEIIEHSEYLAILNAIRNRQNDPEGYRYRLTADLTWELHREPITAEIEREAEVADYLAALERLGVSADD